MAGIIEAGKARWLQLGRLLARGPKLRPGHVRLADRTSLQGPMCSCNNAIALLTAVVLSVYCFASFCYESFEASFGSRQLHMLTCACALWGSGLTPRSALMRDTTMNSHFPPPSANFQLCDTFHVIPAYTMRPCWIVMLRWWPCQDLIHACSWEPL